MRICQTCGAENPEHASFCLACGASLARADASNERRKTVTVLFCDVVGSTSLGEREDPEVVRLLMQHYFADAKEAIERHGGIVEKFIGDAVVAVFGIPQIHEDDPVRAVRAATDIHAAVAKINAELGDGALAVRIGVNTGEVIASSGGTGEAMVTGDAVNTAARLQQAGEPGDVLIGPTTSRMIHGLATLEGPIPLDLKGKAEPLSAFRVTAVSARSTRPLSERSELIGRQTELALLREAIAGLKGGSAPQLVTVLGAAGVGKSRLVSEATGNLDDVLVVSGRCLPYGEGITFWPIREIVFALSGITEQDPQETLRTKIDE
ncbi:MAG: adenylate/guanylate cyclase domain-containing protein, partial [Actinomycetota bacterium]